ncbi:uncharacterized protein LOC131158225 isoform X2 [Malania oleifera]|uniref:uncharacterized protein LOC131158225 isoform X2 n=1 Tax=Malania oleifera TaxID=397392 RepID=UPI0025AE708D|nr:uncharacterized protein LOC131158225 isoform X2 [Malania oleifera]XP_057968925.1 uncharacterized protein LOC131158225 isoform X2 [Malania oleifera]XP_057968926.1 uncharacterized protein LOC131158225 isoform X2 [Malania oleifera]XP_057968927.1 uncharacterized protein LOC131158225 isoform X2 [Malania oleifera]
MCDSPVVQAAFSIGDSLSNCSYSSSTYCNSATHIDHVDEFGCYDLSSEMSNFREEVGSIDSCNKSNVYRFQLEQDVQRLEQKLQEEIRLHAILDDAIDKNVLKLSSPSCVPQQAQELLSNILALDTTVCRLEQEMISLHFQLSQERNERRLAEYHLRQSSSKSMFLCSSDTDATKEQELRDQISEGSSKSSTMYSMIENAGDLAAHFDEKKTSMEVGKLSKWLLPKGLWDLPNQLSEEMVRCMKNIFMSLADSAISSKSSVSESRCSSLSPRGHLSNLSLWSQSERSIVSSWTQSPQIDLQCNFAVLATENACDPYRVRGKLSWADIGSYKLSTEVSWMSVGKKQLEYAAGALRRFRLLVEQLARVNPIHLNCNEKLAFWINLYNALIMHAYLAYGVPRSDLKLFSLMQKAAYTVGGHSFSAAAIEYVILKMKPPVHRPQIALLLALHKLKVTEEQRKFAIDACEPLVAFALSCGMYSCPAIRIYTAQNVKKELQEAQHDFIRASVGVSSKGRLLVPKMLHCFARNFVDDAKLAVWISHYLPPDQAAFVEKCISQRRQSLLCSRNCGILPFDSHFRYLFLPDNISR